LPVVPVLVTGATGAIGPAVREALEAEGLHPRLLVRRPEAVPAGTDAVVGDVTDAAALNRAVRGVDAVVHLAALLHVVDPPPSLQPAYQRVNVEATRALVAAARGAGVRRFVFASTTAVYGDTGGAFADETHAANATSWYAASKLEAERVVREAQEPGAFDTVILRLSAVYGAGVTGNYRRLLDGIARGRFIAIGRGDNRRSLIHDSDVGRAIALALRHPAAAGSTFNVADGVPHPIRTIVAAMASALGRPVPAWSIPVPVAYGAARVAEPIARLLGRRLPLTRASLDKYLEDSAVDASRIAARLGFAPAVDLEHGWRLTVSALRASGALPPAPGAREAGS
jgi:UDP-glucose 4-epimerase